MTTIANLSVSLSARIGNFDKGLKKASRITKRFSRNLNKSTAGLRKIGAIGSVIATTGILTMVRSQFKAIDSISKLSRVVGLSTQKLAAYQYAISISGGSQEGFSKAVLKMNRSIADASGGLSTAIREFDRVGISVKDISKLSTDERIKLLADKYLSIGDAAGKASFLLNVFGRQGASIGNLFEQGASGITELQKEAEKLGLTFSGISAAKIEMANDAFTRLKSFFTGAARVLAVQFAPYLEALNTEMLKVVQSGGNIGDVVTAGFSRALTVVGKLIDGFNLLKTIWYAFQAVVEKSASVFFKIFNFPGKTIEKLVNKYTDLEIYGSGITIDLEAQATEAAANTIDKLSRSYEALINKSGSKNIAGVFENIAEKTEQAAQKISNKLKSPALNFKEDEATKIGIEKSKTAVARSIDLNSVVVGFNSNQKNQSTTKKQGEIIIDTLKQISTNTTSFGSQSSAIIT